MGITCTEDLVIGSKIRVNRDGYWVTRSFLLEGLDPTQVPFVLGGTYAQAGNTGYLITIPTWASLHPYLIGTAAIEVEQTPFQENSRTNLRVVASYGPAELINGWKITVSGSNGSKTLSTYADGTPILVKYTPPNASGGSITGWNASGGMFTITPEAPQQQQDNATFTYLSPGSIVTFEHEEYTSPWSKLQAYKSKTNSVSFLGFAAHQVLCRDIQIESVFGGLRWRVKYVFDIDPSALGWQQTALFIDRYTGAKPSDATTSSDGTKGILTLDPYVVASGSSSGVDFNALNLPTALMSAPTSPTSWKLPPPIERKIK